MKFWFITGSQFLYGEEILRQVEEDSKIIVNGLKLPFPVEYKLTIKTADEVSGIAITEATKPADADLAASVTISVIGFMNLITKAAK